MPEHHSPISLTTEEFMESPDIGTLAKPTDRSADCEVAHTILDAADGLFVRFGYRKTTVEEIAQAAGLGKGTIYLYFKGKEELAYAWLERLHRSLREGLDKLVTDERPAKTRVNDFLMARVMIRYDIFSRYGQSMDEVLESLKTNLTEKRAKFHAHEANLLAEILAQGIANASIRNLEPLRVANGMVTATNALMPYYLRPSQLGNRSEVQQATQDIADLLCLALSPSLTPNPS
jgi:hypothetical protein